MPQWRIACQEELLPDGSIEVQWEFAQSAGFDGIELRVRDYETFDARLGDLKQAVGHGVVMPSVRLDVPLSGDEIRLLGVIAALGGRVAVAPADLPLDDLRRLAERAEREGMTICLRPVNRYEGRAVNTLDQATELCRAVGRPSARVAAATFPMNMEEADPAGALLAAGPWLGHVELADSNGLEPGAGHVDWWAAFAALDAARFEGWTSVACRLSGPAESVLPASVSLLRQAGGW